MAEFTIHGRYYYQGQDWPISIHLEAKQLKEVEGHLEWLYANQVAPAPLADNAATVPQASPPMPQAVAYASKLPADQICPIHKCSMVRSKFPDKGLVDTHFCPKAVTRWPEGPEKTEYCKVKCSLDQNGTLRWANVT